MMRCLAAAALLCCALGSAAAELRCAGVAYVDANTAAAQLGLRPVPKSDGAIFAAGRERLVLTSNKNGCIFAGTKIALSFPAIRRDGRLYVSRLDLEKTLAPLSARRTGVVRHRVGLITVDPGHGGYDQGASGRVLREKFATLLLAGRVATLLRACGFRVRMTRGIDCYLPLGERCRIQRASKSDLFVSIHLNAAVNRTLRGIETYALTPTGAASSSGGKPSSRSFSGNRNDANNVLLANLIQQALLKRTGAFDRGVKRARFAVLRDITVPGVLIEVGFLSNFHEEKLLLDPNYREKLARGIAEGIIVYQRAVARR